MDSVKDVDLIVTDFHSVIFKILRICRKIDPNNIDLEWINSKVSLARDVDPLLIISRCKDKLWAYHDEILREDENFFLNNKFSGFIKNDENKTFMYSFINLLKNKINDLSEAEKKLLWSLIKDMLACVIKYKKATNDFSQ